MQSLEKLPNFLIIGAAKAGTTTLYELLKQHPQVYLSFVKEPMFFSHDDNFHRGTDWYTRTYFRGADRYPVRGEATPHYLYWSEKVAPRIHQTYMQAPLKFLVIFRDPVKRAYSWYWNMVKEGREDLPFDKALQMEDRRLQEHQEKLQREGRMVYGYLRGSCYASALQPFLENFPRQDFLFLLQEDLNRDFSGFVRALLEFLELDTAARLQPVFSNQASMPRSRKLQSWLNNQSRLRDFIKVLVPLQLRHMLRTGIRRVNKRPAEYPPLDPVLEAELRQRLSPEVRSLEQIIGRDLSEWLPR